MTKQKEELRKKTSEFQNMDKKQLILGSILGTIIGLTPFYFQLYKSVPKTKVWDTFLFTYNSGIYENSNTAMWLLSGKIIPLLLLLIWFFTNRHWWYHSLLVPIALYIYQIMGILNEDISYVDELNVMYLLPVMAIVIPSIYLMRAKIFNKINTVTKTDQDLEDELTYRPNSIWEKIKQYF